MTTLIVATASLLGVVVVATLVAILVFLVGIRRFVAETSSILEAVDRGAGRLTNRLEGLQRATAEAAGELRTGGD